MGAREGGTGKRCYRCREVGYLARECPNRQSDDSREREGHQEGSKMGAMICGHASEQPVYLSLWYGRHKLTCLLDTGCQKSVLPSKIVEGMKLEPATEELYAANGTKIATLGAAEIPLRRGGMVLPVDALVTEYVREPMLGMDWMLKNGVHLEFRWTSPLPYRGKSSP